MKWATLSSDGRVVGVFSSHGAAEQNRRAAVDIVEIDDSADARTMRYDFDARCWIQVSAPTERERRLVGRPWDERRSIEIGTAIDLGRQLELLTDFVFALTKRPDIAESLPAGFEAKAAALKADLAAIKAAHPKPS